MPCMQKVLTLTRDKVGIYEIEMDFNWFLFFLDLDLFEHILVLKLGAIGVV